LLYNIKPIYSIGDYKTLEPVKNWTVTVEKDHETDDLILPLPIDLINQMGWDQKTELIWIVENNNIILKEKRYETSNT